MKIHTRSVLLAAGLLALAGCSGGKTQPELKPDYARGARAFDVHCAQCHLDDDNPAPQLDETDDWDLRTHEWTSVLKGHVNSGFLGMPAKGGQSSLSNQNIDDALYYMDVKIKALQ